MKQIKTYNDFVNEAFNWEADMKRRDKMDQAEEEYNDLLLQRKQMDIDMEEEAGEMGDKFDDDKGNEWGAKMDALDKEIEKAKEKYKKAVEVYRAGGKRGERGPNSPESKIVALLKKKDSEVEAFVKKYEKVWKDEKLKPEEIAQTFKGRFGIAANEDPSNIQKALIKLRLITEAETGQIEIDGKEVDQDSLEVDGINKKDYPKFTDAYFSKGKFTDGTDMSEGQLQKLHDKHYEVFFSIISDQLAGEVDFKKDQIKYPF